MYLKIGDTIHVTMKNGCLGSVVQINLTPEVVAFALGRPDLQEPKEIPHPASSDTCSSYPYHVIRDGRCINCRRTYSGRPSDEKTLSEMSRLMDQMVAQLELINVAMGGKEKEVDAAVEAERRRCEDVLRKFMWFTEERMKEIQFSSR